jgi:hypothetical protein
MPVCLALFPFFLRHGGTCVWVHPVSVGLGRGSRGGGASGLHRQGPWIDPWLLQSLRPPAGVVRRCVFARGTHERRPARRTARGPLLMNRPFKMKRRSALAQEDKNRNGFLLKGCKGGCCCCFFFQGRRAAGGHFIVFGVCLVGMK